MNVSNSDRVSFNVRNTMFDFHDPGNTVANETMPGRIYEPSVTTILQKLVQEDGACFLDVGALYGYFSCLVGKMNPNCSIHAFEPGEKHFPILLKNVEENEINATLHRLALSDSDGLADFKGRTLTDSGGGTEKVQVSCYDRWAELNGVRANIAKIDVHGAEGKVLFGMKEALRGHLEHLLIEIHATHLLLNYSYEEILSLLKEAGFRVFELANFREEDEPALVELTGSAYENFVNPMKWTEYQVKNERMIYATKNLDICQWI